MSAWSGVTRLGTHLMRGASSSKYVYWSSSPRPSNSSAHLIALSPTPPSSSAFLLFLTSAPSACGGGRDGSAGGHQSKRFQSVGRSKSALHCSAVHGIRGGVRSPWSTPGHMIWHRLVRPGEPGARWVCVRCWRAGKGRKRAYHQRLSASSVGSGFSNEERAGGCNAK